MAFRIEDAELGMKHLTEIIVSHAVQDMMRVEQRICKEYAAPTSDQLPQQVQSLLLAAGHA